MCICVSQREILCGRERERERESVCVSGRVIVGNSVSG